MADAADDDYHHNRQDLVFYVSFNILFNYSVMIRDMSVQAVNRYLMWELKNKSLSSEFVHHWSYTVSVKI